uniref:3-deoxy-7-phosphoheptulonate synthase n=1 Tax=Pseudomonas aeruginosa TaxID=287 RepID=UPI001E3C5A76
PRSKPHEQVGEQTLPVYRGDMVNGREAHAEQRRADPQRILKGYAAARNIMRHLGWDAASGQEANASPVWTSHEMLLLVRSRQTKSRSSTRMRLSSLAGSSGRYRSGLSAAPARVR